MNILIISFEFPPTPGGMGEYAFQTAKHLAWLNHSVTVIASYDAIDETTLADFREQQSFTLIRLEGYNGRSSFVLRSFSFFKRIYKKYQIDLIITVTPNAGLVSWILNKRYTVPYIMIGHGSEFLPSNRIHDLLIRAYYNNSNLILANSRFTKQLAEKQGIDADKIRIVHPGADTSLFDITQFPPKQPGGKTIILSVGALSVRKGHRFVLEAVNLLRDRVKGFEYWIIGKGSEKENILTYIREHHLEPVVRLIGFVPREELPGYYAQSDIFILNSTDQEPTQVEGFGIVLIEANLMRLPVIGAKNSGMEDAIEHGVNGLLIHTKNVHEIASTLERLITEDETRIRLGTQGYNRAMEKFTWERFGENLNRIISDELSSRR